MITVLHIISSLEVGGAEKLLLRLVANFPENFDHEIISLKPEGKVAVELRELGINVLCLDFRMSRFPSELLRLWKAVKKSNPDVIQTWMYHSDVLGGVVGRFCGVKHIAWNIRNTEIPQQGLSITRLLIICGAWLSKIIPNVIISCSTAGKEKHVRLGYDASKFRVIPNGYAEKSSSGAAKAGVLPLQCERVGSVMEPGRTIAVVGRWDPLKGYDTFFSALAILIERIECPVHVLFAGRELNLKNLEFAALIPKRLGNVSIAFYGELDDVFPILRHADFLCLPSRAEGFPNVVAEAMSCGTPCVVSDVGDAAVIVGQAGFVVPPDDPNALADKLLEVIMLPADQISYYAELAIERVRSQFSLEIMCDRYAAIYENLLVDDNI